MPFYILKTKRPSPDKAGIISFKNMSDGFMGVTLAGDLASDGHEVSAKLLEAFEMHLIALIEEICNAQIPFTEKEIV